MKPLLNTLTQITSLLLFKMTYSQKANPNATDSELDAKKIVYPEYRGLPDFNEKLSPTEDKIIQALCEEVVWQFIKVSTHSPFGAFEWL